MSALFRDAQALTSEIARSIGEASAVAWVHSGALLRHATQAGLAPALPAGAAASVILSAVERLAAAHPALAAFADPAANVLWSAKPKPAPSPVTYEQPSLLELMEGAA